MLAIYEKQLEQSIHIKTGISIAIVNKYSK